jgi:hypothetical protein
MKLIYFKIQLHRYDRYEEPENNCCTLPPKLNWLLDMESGLFLEFVMSETRLEQPITVPVAITHSIINMQRNMTQDMNDKIFILFSHSKYVCHCSRGFRILANGVVILGREGEPRVTSWQRETRLERSNAYRNALMCCSQILNYK